MQKNIVAAKNDIERDFRMNIDGISKINDLLNQLTPVELQLLNTGSMSHEDLEALRIYQALKRICETGSD